MVTKKEFDELMARVEKLEAAQKARPIVNVYGETEQELTLRREVMDEVDSAIDDMGDCFATNDELDRVDSRCEELEDRMDALETRLDDRDAKIN